MPWTRVVALLPAACLLAACQTWPDPDARAPDPGTVAVAPPASTPMPRAGSRQEPPPAFVIFCLRFADQCRSDAEAPAVLGLDATRWSALQTVNAGVNRAIQPLDDLRHFGRVEYWTIPTDGYGSCHDYALTKRKQLIDAGIPQRALRIAIVVTPRNNRHAVLTVATDKGDYVLDNLTDEILPWSATGYSWIARQDDRGEDGWVAFGPASASSATAAISATTR